MNTNLKHAQAGGMLAKLLLLLVILFGIGAVAWILFIPRLVVSQIHSKTGFNVTVDHLWINPFTANVSVKGMVLKNPEGWPVADFVNLREFRIDANLLSLFSARIVANEAVLDVAKCTLVKNQKGTFNAKAFADALNRPGPSTSEAKSKGKPKEFLIKHLLLKFDTLVYVDNSGTNATTREYNLNLNQDLQNVDSIAKIVAPISTASIGVLSDALSGAINGRTDLLKDAAGAIQGAGKKTGEKLKGLLDSLDKKRP